MGSGVPIASWSLDPSPGGVGPRARTLAETSQVVALFPEAGSFQPMGRRKPPAVCRRQPPLSTNGVPRLKAAVVVGPVQTERRQPRQAASAGARNATEQTAASLGGKGVSLNQL